MRRRASGLFCAVTWLALLAGLAGSLSAGLPPRPAGGDFLHDYAQVVPASTQATIRAHQAAIFEAHQVPLVVVTVPNLRLYDLSTTTIETYAKAWFDGWGIGSAKKNDGILILVAVRERQARIELGAAWGHRWDDYAQRVMNGRMVPRFKNGDYGGGILAGLEALERMAASGPDAEPPSLSGWEKFAESPLGYYALYDNPLKRSVGLRLSAAVLGVGALLLLAGCFLPPSRRQLWTIGGGLIGIVLLFWIAVVVFVLVSGLLQRVFDRDRSNSDEGSGGGFDGGSSGGGGATGSW